MSSAIESNTVHRADAPDIVFDGALLASIAGPKADARWTALSLYELGDRSWVAVRTECSDAPEQADCGEVVHILAERPSNMQIKAMTLWRWSWLAKELAGQSGWDVRERLGRTPPG